jgi:hypothetical protein
MWKLLLICLRNDRLLQRKGAVISVGALLTIAVEKAVNSVGCRAEGAAIPWRCSKRIKLMTTLGCSYVSFATRADYAFRMRGYSEVKTPALAKNPDSTH